MKKTKEKLVSKVNSLFEKPVSVFDWALSFLGIITLRLFLDNFVAKGRPFFFDYITQTHNFLFFFLSFLLIWIFLAFVLKENPKRLSRLMLLALPLLLLPPIMDLIKTGGAVYGSFYLISAPKELWLQFISFFGHLPSGIVYFGTRINFALSIVLLVIIVFIKTKSIWKTLLSGFGTYCILFFMAAFPSLFYLGKCFFDQNCSLAQIKSFQIVSFFAKDSVSSFVNTDISMIVVYKISLIYFFMVVLGLFLLFWRMNKLKFISVMANWRYPQVIYLSGLLLIGSGLGFLAYPESLKYNFFSASAFLVLLVSVWLAWKASVVTNDIYDFEVDKISNSNRPLSSEKLSFEEYKSIGIVCFFLSLLGSFSVGPTFGFLMIVFHIIAWFYSVPPFRTKRIPFLATLNSSLAAIVVLFMGFIFFSGSNDLQGLSPRIIFLLIITYTLCLPIKDFKDIEGDKKDQIKTIPVIFGEEKGRLIVGISFFASYILSVFFLNAWDLFWWALLFGTLSFWIINNKKIASRRLIPWNLGIVLVYGIILVKIVFFTI